MCVKHNVIKHQWPWHQFQIIDDFQSSQLWTDQDKPLEEFKDRSTVHL